MSRLLNTFSLKRIAIGFTAAAALSLASHSVMAQDVQKRVIRFGYGLAEESPTGKATRYFADKVKELSDGKLDVRTYGNGSLGSDEQMQNALIGGSQEMTFVSTAPLAGLVKEFGVFDLPFLFDNEKVADYVLDGPEGRKLLDMLNDKGLVALLYWENGFRNITNSNREIKAASDLEGIKLRVMQNQVALSVFNGLGANAIPMPFTELFTALETKTVDGQENPLSTIQTSKFYEVQPYLTISNHVYTPFVLLASKKWWDKLSADEKKIIETAAKDSQQYQRKISREANVEALAYLKDQGVKVSQFSTAEKEAIRDKLEPILADLKVKIGAPTVDAILAEAKKGESQ
ncbi:TRAP transporter substrate-binding protein [Pollutimonas thiosulfatoxidans]|uniref:ABC transporter substrate-binding protein n=1 Tax=Pollutimonas thiosulfatoxidans TaxID=2028345 RepID=A0A410GFB5_9BURK|nr:TRAP transporter substrate-binding protein [Pollutimonas thiosulfatoxidans]MBF6615678.1 TRAP transporter substrate-binding protein [Candidimonas sp.]NYT45385.1 TRAP transporter substrate-binding protein [Alcaligenaceae bacterium]QAA94987.1 ABC transporter substrate-binding protein [Pollutimonas thiosulfatoxidans]